MATRNSNKLVIFETWMMNPKKLKTMKKSLLFALSFFMLFGAKAQSEDCFKKLEEAFQKRGSYTVADDMHKNVILSFFEGESSYCLSGKVRVENGVITSIFIQFKEGDYELLEKKFYNAQKTQPKITNGISEMIFTADGEKIRVVFIDKLKPKQREYQKAKLPDDL